MRTSREDGGRASSDRGSSLSPETAGSGDAAWRVARTAALGEGASRGRKLTAGSVAAGGAATRCDPCAAPLLPNTAGWASTPREGGAAAAAGVVSALADCGGLLPPPPPSAAFSRSRRYWWTAAWAALRETSPRTAGDGGGSDNASVLASWGAVAAFTRLPTCLSAASTAASTARCTASRLRAGKTSKGEVDAISQGPSRCGSAQLTALLPQLTQAHPAASVLGPRALHFCSGHAGTLLDTAPVRPVLGLARSLLQEILSHHVAPRRSSRR